MCGAENAREIVPCDFILKVVSYFHIVCAMRGRIPMKLSKRTSLGYFFALFTVVVWGTTFIASKQLLTAYTPARIMLMRFVLAYIALWMIRPRPLKLPWRSELRFAALGLAGCSLYFLTENTALLHTTAANVSIIVSAAPIFTAILAHFTTD